LLGELVVLVGLGVMEVWEVATAFDTGVVVVMAMVEREGLRTPSAVTQSMGQSKSPRTNLRKKSDAYIPADAERGNSARQLILVRKVYLYHQRTIFKL
jgi:hypothetical protein